jgi:hypothetical protein
MKVLENIANDCEKLWTKLSPVYVLSEYIYLKLLLLEALLLI